MVGGDVVRQDRQWAHAFHLTLTGHIAFPIRGAANIGALRAPVVQRWCFCLSLAGDVEHRNVDLTELRGLDRRFDDGVDLFISWPDVFQGNRVALLVIPQHILFDIEADGTGNRVGHYQRRRGQKGLLGIGVNTPVKIAVTREHGGSVKITLDHLFLDHRVQRARHTVTGSTGKGDHIKTQLLQLRQQAGLLQIHFHRLGAGCQRTLDPGLAQQTQAIGITRQQTGTNNIARIGGVGAAGNSGDNYRAIGHQTLFAIPVLGDTTTAQLGHRQQRVRIGWSGHVAGNRGQVKAQHALIIDLLQRIRPEAGLFRILFDQRDLLVFSAGQLEVFDGLVVDKEHTRAGAVFGRHVGDGRAIAQRQAIGTLTKELQISTHHALAAQKFGQRQHQVGTGNARLQLAAQLDPDNFGQTHHRRIAEHYVLGFQSTHTNGDDAQRINHGRVAIGTHTGIRKGNAITHLHHRRHFLQVDLMHDAVARRNHINVVERRLGPVDEVEAIFVAAVFYCPVLGESVRLEAGVLDGQRVIDNQLGRYHRIDLGRITALLGDNIAQPGQIHQRGLAQNVVAYHTRRIPGKVQGGLSFDQLIE